MLTALIALSAPASAHFTTNPCTSTVRGTTVYYFDRNSFTRTRNGTKQYPWNGLAESYLQIVRATTGKVAVCLSGDFNQNLDLMGSRASTLWVGTYKAAAEVGAGGNNAVYFSGTPHVQMVDVDVQGEFRAFGVPALEVRDLTVDSQQYYTLDTYSVPQVSISNTTLLSSYSTGTSLYIRNSDDLTVSSTTIQSMGDTALGIYTYLGGDVTLADLTVEGNRAFYLRGDGTLLADGIIVDSDLANRSFYANGFSSASLSNASFTSTATDSTGYAMVQMDGGGAVSLDQVLIDGGSGTWWTGVYASGSQIDVTDISMDVAASRSGLYLLSDQVRIDGGEVRATGGYSMVETNGSSSEVVGLDISGTMQVGIDQTGDYGSATVENNILSGYTQVGIRIDKIGGSVNAHRNQLRGTANTGLALHSTLSQAAVSHNSFYGHSYGINNETDADITFNTFVNNTNGVWVSGGGSQTGNLFIGNQIALVGSTGALQTPSNWNFFDGTVATDFNTGVDYDLPAWQALTGNDADSRNSGSVGFIDGLGRDPHLYCPATALQNGVPAGRVDIDGVYNPAWSMMGADECP